MITLTEAVPQQVWKADTTAELEVMFVAAQALGKPPNATATVAPRAVSSGPVQLILTVDA